MFQKIKNFLKRMLPPPVRTFLREIERVLAEIRGQGSKHSNEVAALNAEISALRKEREEFGRQLRQEQEEAAYILSNISEVQKQTVAALSELRAKIENESAISESEFGRVRKEIETVSQSLNKQSGELVELRKRMQQHERNIISKIDREKQELFYEYYSRLKPEDYERELALWYRKRTGKVLNLSDPKTYNEKIQWLKLYDSTPLKTRLADKYLVRDWVKEKIGEEYLIPLLGVWDSFDEIDFDSLPNEFALKTNHGSGWNLIVNDKSQLDKTSAKRSFDAWIKKTYAFNNGFEMQYLNITPKIIAEKYIENAEGLIDYRFYCFNGKPEQVWVDIFSGTSQHLRSVFDMQWNSIPLQCTWPDGGDLLSKKPKNFDKMNEFATLLSKDFAFVRVDFFEVDERLFVGEMTFTPMGGVGKFVPNSWDEKLGDMLVLPEKEAIPELKL